MILIVLFFIIEVDHDYDKTHSEPHQYETITGVCTKEELVDLTKYNWYHGKLTEEEIKVTFNLSGCHGNCFFVRQETGNEMILSRKTMEGKISHDKILRSPEGFHLKLKKELFKSIPNMIAHYQQVIITANQQLGKPIDRQGLGMESS